MNTGYRAFPPFVEHPSKARRFETEEFLSMTKAKLEEAPAVCAGHAGTIIWYAEQLGYVVEIRFVAAEPVYISSGCTFTPSAGMDRIDGELAQDAEEHVLHQVLGYNGTRLAIYPDSGNLPIEAYLRARGYAADAG